MKKLFPILLFFLSLSAFAQEWQTDLAAAKKTASQENKEILLVFQGSDWCAPCIKLDRELWSTDEFKKYAADHYVMLQADFPRKKKNALPEAQQKKNNTLAEKYNSNGIFPLVVKLDKTGKVLGKTSYTPGTSVQEYIKVFNSFKS